MNIDFFETFISVMQTQNYTHTAALTNLSQSTVSNRISELEKIFNVNLFIRIEGRIEPTNAAKQLLPYAETIISAQKNAKKSLSQKSSIEHSVTVGSVHAFYDCYLESLIREELPHYTSIKIFLKHSREIILGVVSGKYDIVFSHFPCNYNNYISKLLFREDLLLVSGKKPEVSSIKVSELEKMNIYHSNYFEKRIENLLFKNSSFKLSIDIGSRILPYLLY